MKKLWISTALIAVLTSNALAHDEIHSIQEYEALTKKGNVIVDFYAPWCLPCGELSLNLKKLHIDENLVKIYKVNIDENPDLQALYAKPQIPTLLYMKDGKVIDGHIGSKTVSQLQTDIANYFY